MFKKHIVLETTDADDTGLIAIHSSVEPYLLAYKFNQHLSTQFVNLTEKEDKHTQPIFPRFVWEPIEGEDPWELIANQYVVAKDTQDDSLLFSVQQEQINYLIDKLREVDYFLKLPSKELVQSKLTAIQTISQVQFAYAIHEPTIQLNPNLIFE